MYKPYKTLIKRKEIGVEIPKGWRKGQTLFVFLEWLKTKKGVEGNQNQRLADTFHLSDKELESYIKEYNELTE